MGCDIHIWLELVHSEDYVECLHGAPDNRSYDLFGLLAGVRNYIDTKPISEPRGWPEKVSWQAREEYEGYGTDGHSHSWLTVKDFKEHDWNYESVDGRVSTIDLSTGEEKGKASYTYLQEKTPEELAELGVELRHLTRKSNDILSPLWRAFLRYMYDLGDLFGDEKVRLVFFFDN